MSKKLIYSAFFVAVFISLFSCKEQPVIINGSIEATDTTYVTTPETPQPKKVLATELTGVQCPNCPDGAELLDTLSKQNGNDLVIVSLHSGVLTQPLDEPNAKSKYDFRTSDGDAILNQILGGDPGAKPAVCYNRMRISNDANPFFIESYSQNWAPKLTTFVLPVENPVLINLTVQSKYNQTSGKYDIQVKIAYNQAITGKQRLNLFLTEDSIIDVQQTSNPSNEFDTNYVFMHVFRKAITGISGQPILDSLATKEAGRVFIFNTSYTLAPPPNQGWDPKHMHIVAFVSDESNGDIHVYQAAQTPLEGN